MGASDLYTGFSDYVSPFGMRPTTGTVRFVQNLAGTGDVTAVCAGDTLYISVDDGDRNYNPTGLNTVPVTLAAPSGDSEPLTLTETGVNTGIFTGAIISAAGTPSAGDGTLQVMPGETVTVTYIDTIDGSIPPLQDQPRTDTLTINPPVIAVTKTVSTAAANGGETITYTITIENSSCGEAWLTYLSDVMPDGFTYVPGSTTGFITARSGDHGFAAYLERRLDRGPLQHRDRPRSTPQWAGWRAHTTTRQASAAPTSPSLPPVPRRR